MKSFLMFLVLCVATLGLRAQAPVDIPPRPQAPNDDAEYRRFVLANGLKVILLSDPKLNKSSASLAVAVGSYSDPANRQGLAHFLEHMLFLGTEKYPDVTDYGNYLKSNGGYNNAYTAGDHTNYLFEIRHEAFEGAIDRMSQFFIAPLFTPEFTEREMNAVNSENQKNLENDLWRQYQLQNSLYRAGHPANHFSTGSRETLGGTTREELLAFYHAHYSANRMTLALVGKASLDQLEQWARKYFTPVQDRKLAPIAYPADYFPPQAAVRLVRMVPIKDLRTLTLEFPLPGMRQHWAAKPAALLGFILGHEGEDSLLSTLKAEGLATGLGAGANSNSTGFGSFDVQIQLTPAGLEKYPRVMELFFAAVKQVSAAGYPAYLFKERAAMARLDESYKDKGEGADRAVLLANQIRDYPFEIAEREPYLWLTEDPAAYADLLGRIRPDNLLAILTAKGLTTDQHEKYYNTPYSYTEDRGPAYAALLNPPAVASIKLPKANPFIPASAALKPIEPVHLINEPALSLHYVQDAEFLRPMAAQVYRFRLPRKLASLETSVLLRFYEACVKESLNETAYTASEAGLNFALTAALEGVQFFVEGYDASAPLLLETVTGNLVNFSVSEERFTAIKDRIVRALASFPRGDAYLTLTESRRAVAREFYYRPDDQLPAAEKITLAAVKAFAKQLYAEGKLEALVHGNISADEASASARKVAAALAAKPVADANLLRRRLLVQTPGETIRTSEKLLVNNSAYRREYALGDASPALRAATAVLANFISEPFYAEMRTRQQLGYIVSGGAGDEENRTFSYFIIQSGDHPADVVEARADEMINKLPVMLGSLPDADWTQLIGGVRAQLEEKDKSVAARANRLFTLAYDRDGDWDRNHETLAALDKLTKEQARDLLAHAISPEHRQMRTFLGFARQHEAKTPTPATFTDRPAWKKTRLYDQK